MQECFGRGWRQSRLARVHKHWERFSRRSEEDASSHPPLDRKRGTELGPSPGGRGHAAERRSAEGWGGGAEARMGGTMGGKHCQLLFAGREGGQERIHEGASERAGERESERGGGTEGRAEHRSAARHRVT